MKIVLADEELSGVASPLDRLFGRYELIEQLSRGGMGIIYKAREPALNRIVALKVIVSGEFACQEQISRFQLEAEAAATLTHPGIIPIYDIGENEGHRYFSMKLMEGSLADSLHSYFGKHAAAAELMAKICRAVHFAHARGILHRDLKPSNILLDGRGEPVVSDFGLAKFTQRDNKITRTNVVMGTPAFMAPEQVAGMKTEQTVAADVYSLGAILYNLLTGKVPFEADEPWQMVQMLVHEDPVRPTVSDTTIDVDLETICLKCLEKQPQRRYASAEALAEDLERWLADEPVLARPSGAWRRTRKWIKRRPAAATLVGLGSAALISFALLVSHNQVGLQRERNRALQQEGIARQRQREAEDAAFSVAQQRIEELFAADNTAPALAHIAHSLRQNPTSRIAAERLLSALMYRSFPVPLGDPMQHGGRVNTVEFSPDGTRVLTASADGSARIWSARTGRAVADPLRHNAEVSTASFSMDGLKILTGSADGTARLWDSRTGQPLLSPFVHSNAVILARFSPDGTRFLSLSRDHTCRVWDTDKGQLLLEPWTHMGSHASAEFSPDGKRIVTANQDGRAYIWDAATGSRLCHTPNSKIALAAVAFSPHGEYVLGAFWDRTVRIFDSSTGAMVGLPVAFNGYPKLGKFTSDGAKLSLRVGLQAEIWDSELKTRLCPPVRHAYFVRSCEFSADGSLAVTASEDFTARVWDCQTGHPICEPFHHDDIVLAACFSPDGGTVATASEDGWAWLWDVRPNESLSLPLPHEAAVWRAHFSSDGQKIITASHDKVARVWDAGTGLSTGVSLLHTSKLSRAEFSPDGRFIATASDSNSAHLWETDTGRLIASIPHAEGLRSVEFSPDGKQLATCSFDGTARVWDSMTAQPITPFLRHADIVNAATFSRDGGLIATASTDGTARVWDARSGNALTPSLKHEGAVFRVQFSHDGRLLLTSSDDRTARIWEVSTALSVGPTLRHRDKVRSACFSPDGTKIATASWDGTARIWAVATGMPISEPMQHANAVNSIEFSADGLRVATSSSDGTARIWDATTGRTLSEPFRHKAVVRTAEWSPDGRWLLTACDDRNARIWEVPLVRGFTPEWLPELAQFIGRHRLNADGILERIPPGELSNMKTRLWRQIRTAPVWMKWWTMDRLERTISPHSIVGVSDYLKRFASTNTPQAIFRALSSDRSPLIGETVLDGGL